MSKLKTFEISVLELECRYVDTENIMVENIPVWYVSAKEFRVEVYWQGFEGPCVEPGRCLCVLEVL